MKGIISKHFNFINNLLATRYRILLLALVAMIILPSFINNIVLHQWAAFLSNAIVILLSIHAVHETKKQLIIGCIVALGVILVNRFGIFKESATIDFYLSFIAYIMFYAYIAYRLMLMILRTDNVTRGVLFAAVIVYLLIGIIGGYLYMLIENANPGSLNNLAIEDITNPSNFFYFSFTTLSTLGYGDITPASASAQSLSIILSTAGPLYLTILVALLVSRFEHSEIH